MNVFKVTFVVGEVPVENTEVCVTLPNASYYNSNGLKTDDFGKLHFWLPINTIHTISVEADGKTYVATFVLASYDENLVVLALCSGLNGGNEPVCNHTPCDHVCDHTPCACNHTPCNHAPCQCTAQTGETSICQCVGETSGCESECECECTEESDSGLTTGGIVGIAVGSAAAFGGGAFGLSWFLFNKKVKISNK
jgi:hypothetical protein